MLWEKKIFPCVPLFRIARVKYVRALWDFLGGFEFRFYKKNKEHRKRKMLNTLSKLNWVLKNDVRLACGCEIQTSCGIMACMYSTNRRNTSLPVSARAYCFTPTLIRWLYIQVQMQVCMYVPLVRFPLSILRISALLEESSHAIFIFQGTSCKQ